MKELVWREFSYSLLFHFPKLPEDPLCGEFAAFSWLGDAAPYFRIFNPVLQGEKFDPNGEYVRRWVPELGLYKPTKK